MLNVMKSISFIVLAVFLALTLVCANTYNSNVDLSAYGVEGNVDTDVDVKNVQVNPDGTVKADIDVKSNFKGNVNGQAVDSSSNANYKVDAKPGESVDVSGTVKTSDGQTITDSRYIDLKNINDVKSIQADTKVKLSNGQDVEIKVIPSAASQTAIDKLSITACSEDNKCTIEIKEVGSGDNIKIAYEIKADKNVKVFGLFKSTINVNAQVDVETGEVIKVNKPWWSFMALSSD